MAEPTFERAVAYLCLEEHHLKNLHARAVHTAFPAGYRAPAQPAPATFQQPPRPPAPAAPFPAPQPQQRNGGGRRRRGGGGRNGGGNGSGNGGGGGGNNGGGNQQPTPPWGGGHNPWTGVVHAYTMPVPRPPIPGLLGSRPPNHQAFFTATPPYAPAYNAAPPSYALAYGYAPAYGGAPAYAPQQPAWGPALYAALQQAPAPGAYAGSGDWFLDSGASTHMAAHPGNLSHSFPTSTESHIIVGNGAGLTISHIGSTSFPSSSRPLSLNNVIVSPYLI
jgi:hypothetical protein